jgi:hypothetical protein
MAAYRTSGFDFSDNAPNGNLEQHPDLAANAAQPVHLQRNKTERRRLQGLQRSLTASSMKKPAEPKTLRERFSIWMINEGGRQLFFGTWIFLHLLVAVFGFINYQLKDNLVDARALFGVTFSGSTSFSLRFFLTLHY